MNDRCSICKKSTHGTQAHQAADLASERIEKRANETQDGSGEQAYRGAGREEALFQAANTAAINLATSMNLREHPDSCECYGCRLNRAVVNFALARARENVRPIVERELQAERWLGADTADGKEGGE